MEKCALGGLETVRGYPENTLVRDECFVASLEFRVPVYQLPLAGISRGPNEGQVQLAAFADYGYAKNKGAVRSGAEFDLQRRPGHPLGAEPQDSCGVYSGQFVPGGERGRSGLAEFPRQFLRAGGVLREGRKLLMEDCVSCLFAGIKAIFI